MKFVLERVTDPDIEPITLEEIKRHLRAYTDVTIEDDDFTALVVAGREWVEGYTGRALIDQTWCLTIDGNMQSGGDLVTGFDSVNAQGGWRYADWLRWIRRGEIALRRAPVIAIVSIKSVDQGGAETDIDPASYELREPNSKWPRLVPMAGNGSQTSTLKIVYRAGFADRTGSPKQDASAVPARFKQAIKLWAEANYDRDPVMMPLLLKVAAEIVEPERAFLSIA